jgi:hypothetical protein
MPNGQPGNGFGGGGGYSPPPKGTYEGSARRNGKKKEPVTSVKKSIGHVASGSDSNKLMSFSQSLNTASDDATLTSVNDVIPSKVVVTNTGNIPTLAIFVYEEYTDTDTDAGQATVQTMLLPNESATPPIKAAIVEAGNNPLRALNGTATDFTTTLGDTSNTTADFESDSGDNVASGEFNNTDDPVVFQIDNGHEKYRVGDYLRCENEIVKVEGTYDDNPTTSAVADDHIVVSRGHFGSTNAVHSGTPDLMFPCTNEYHDYDIKLQGNSQLVSTDGLGRFKLSNFFGYGRKNATADNETFGVVAGSVCFRFWSKAYQNVFMGGTGATGGTGGSNIPISPSTDSKLTASTAYAFNLTIDDSSAVTVSFTTDSSNTNFGGSNGVIAKIQDAINTATRTAGNNLYGYGCTVSIKNGGLRFTSSSNLSPHDGTNGSKILLADAGSGTNLFEGTSGIFTDILNVPSAVAPVISPVSVYDPITYTKTPNIGAMCYDNGEGDLIYNNNKVGKINYETGAFDMTIPSLPNAEFEFSLSHSSVFAGKLDNAKEDSNSLIGIYGNVTNKNMTGELRIEVF